MFNIIFPPSLCYNHITDNFQGSHYTCRQTWYKGAMHINWGKIIHQWCIIKDFIWLMRIVSQYAIFHELWWAVHLFVLFYVEAGWFVHGELRLGAFLFITWLKVSWFWASEPYHLFVGWKTREILMPPPTVASLLGSALGILLLFLFSYNLLYTPPSFRVPIFL